MSTNKDAERELLKSVCRAPHGTIQYSDYQFVFENRHGLVLRFIISNIDIFVLQNIFLYTNIIHSNNFHKERYRKYFSTFQKICIFNYISQYMCTFFSINHIITYNYKVSKNFFLFGNIKREFIIYKIKVLFLPTIKTTMYVKWQQINLYTNNFLV